MPSAHIESSPPHAETGTLPVFSVRGLWGYLRQVFCVMLFFGIGLIVSPICAVLVRVTRIPPVTGQRLILRLFSFWVGVCERLGVFEISLPEGDKLRSLRGVIIAPNHPSVIDAVLLLAVLPQTVCVMRSQLIHNLFIGGAAQLAGYVPNDSGPALIRHGIDRLNRGQNLLIFPEGTRTRTEMINPFKNGFALIATRTGTPIQTIFIEREGRYLSKGMSLFAFARPPFRFRIHLGPSVQAEPGESAQELSSRLESEFRSRLENTGTDIRLKSPLA